MVLVFQFGSNLSQERLNSAQRLNGTACLVDTAWTVDDYELEFTVWSKSNGCAAANLAGGKGRKIWGVLYEIPEERVFREKKQPGNRCLDQVEGEGSNYKRQTIKVRRSSGEVVEAYTYLALNPRTDIKTYAEYVSHIIKGMKEHGAPPEYIEYVRERINENNPAWKGH